MEVNPMNALKRCFLLIFALQLLAAGPTQAAGVTEIQIVHALGRIFVIENGTLSTSEGYPLEAGSTIDVPKGHEVRVVIVDPNLVLYQYKLEKLTPIITENQKELLELATSLDALAKTLAAGIQKAGDERGKLATKEAESCNDSIEAVKSFKAAVDSIEKARKESQTVIVTSFAKLDRAKELVRDWNLPELQKKLTKAREDLDKVTDKLLESVQPNPCAGIVALARDRARDVQKTLDELKSLSDLVEQSGTPIALTPFTVKITENQPVKISISRTKLYPDSLPPNARFVGDTTITVAPRSRVDISVAPAMVYSFVRDPAFEAEEKNGQIFIREKENPYKGLDLAAMLELEPHAWDLGPLNLGVQLGVMPQSDWGLFLGFSMRASDLFTFGAGVAFQKVKRLQEGLSPNQQIASKDLLKTEDDFDQGLYLHLTVSLPKKN
jgi:hypothetical protein